MGGEAIIVGTTVLTSATGSGSMLRVSPLPVGSETFFVENVELQSSFRPPSRHVSPRVAASIDASVSRGSTPSLPPSPATAGSNPAEVRERFTVEASRSTGYGYDRGVHYRDALRQQRKTWGGPVNEEFWFYVCNTHEILSIFMQHPKHPIAMWQRVVMLLVSSTLSLAWS